MYFFLHGIRVLTEENESYAARIKVLEEELFKIKADEYLSVADKESLNNKEQKSTGVLNILT